MLDLNPFFTVIETCIKSLGVDPNLCRGQKPGQWDLKKGSASVWVDVFLSSQDENYGYFQTMAPICQIPTANREAFFKESLEINHQLYGVSFTVYKDWLYLKMIRELAGLDQNEAMAMLNRTGVYADQYDDHFKNKYHGGVSSGDRAPGV